MQMGMTGPLRRMLQWSVLRPVLLPAIILPCRPVLQLRRLCQRRQKG